MAESLFSQTVLGFSTAKETTYGTNPVTASLFTPMVTRARAFPVPQTEKTDDRGVIGRGSAMYPSYQRSGFAVPTAFEITDVAQVSTAVYLVKRFMGKDGVAPSNVETTIAYKHTFKEQDPTTEGLQLPSSSWIYSLNEYDFLLPGGVGSTMQFSQQGTADPMLTMSIVTSGNAKNISEDYPAFGTLAVPPQDNYMYGASSAMQFTDATPTVVSLTTPTHKLRSTTFSVNNSLDTTDTRAGMPQIDTDEPRRGWYRDFLFFGDRQVSAEFTMGMDSSYTLKSAEELNTAFTLWTWDMFGDMIPTTAASNKYSIKIVIPKFNIRAPAVGEANAMSTKTFTLFPLVHVAYYGVYSIEMVNGISATID